MTTRAVREAETKSSDPVAALQNSYEQGVTDEFVRPTVVGEPVAHRVREGDVCLCFNYRPDRARELFAEVVRRASAESEVYRAAEHRLAGETQ